MIGDAAMGTSPPRGQAELYGPSYASAGPPQLRCCCGDANCVVLRHNCSILDSVEKDVHMAAKLGQALLVRHEAYMADSERDRAELTSRIVQLETDKKELEAMNAKTIEENRLLLDQLEELNNSVAESDSRIHLLEASLQASEQTVRRLEITASRAADMERHIATLEQDLEHAQGTLVTSEEEARSASRRWRIAERTITDLQNQLELMERGAREERERQAEIIERMERQREIERELSTAAGRLKGAAAAKSLNAGVQSNTGTVVSHFVRDLLQDNANLQLGIAELRELLGNSSDEIQALRDRLALHQPIQESPSAPSVPSLRVELGFPQSSPPSREVHIHHHYHVTPKNETRKSKKRRSGMNSVSSFLPPTPELSSPSLPPIMREQWETPLSHDFYPREGSVVNDAETEPSIRWSRASNIVSEFGLSTLASSPRSNPRLSVFDGSVVVDSEGPPSPSTSIDPLSPTFKPEAKGLPMPTMAPSSSMHGFIPSSPSPASTTALSLGIVEMLPSSPSSQNLEPPIQEISQEEDDGDDSSSTRTTTERDIPVAAPNQPAILGDFTSPLRPSLRRTVSHESIMSLSGGLDIHTLKNRPSQLTLCQLGSAQAIVTGITAQPTLSPIGGKRGSTVLRDSLAALPSSTHSSRAISNPTSSLSTLGRWRIWRPWGGRVSTGGNGGDGDDVETGDNGGTDINPPSSCTSSGLNGDMSSQSKPKASAKEKEKDKELLRAPGINQPGAIPGFQEYWAAQRRRGAPSKVQPETVDQAALKDILEN
ncbi:hypothetical protein jhhlp_006046 [Lomentospora prolificans]|uniref:Uncharacterized protein n=1 Tax=Lomentospora prolificans TaxID=41688 RepID=A0A2N3N4Y9_9PEZI|nr:hypothetical protein jhhlp_006046 [Lomentospora prolificans]